MSITPYTVYSSIFKSTSEHHEQWESWEETTSQLAIIYNTNIIVFYTVLAMVVREIQSENIDNFSIISTKEWSIKTIVTKILEHLS